MIDDANQPTYKRVRKAILFTDIEGSTHWLNDKGPSVVFQALEKHFNIFESSFEPVQQTFRLQGDPRPFNLISESVADYSQDSGFFNSRK